MPRSQAPRKGRATPLLPAEDSREATLFFVIAALCFLAALAGIVSRGAYGAAQAWTSEVEGELSVLIEGADRRTADEAVDVIRGTPGVDQARLLDRSEVAELVERSFGAGGVPEGLPLPDLIAIDAAPDRPDTLRGDVRRRLTEAGIAATVEDHASWAGDVRRMLGSVRWAGIGVVLLLVATAVAVIASATHANLLARRDVVDTLHLSGARDRYISRLFERRYWLLGLRAGLVGALFALGVAAFLVFAAQSEDGRNWLLPRLSLGVFDILILLAAPIVAGFVSRLAARVTVMHNLREGVL
jgi:cell division transport system permease protein